LVRTTEYADLACGKFQAVEVGCWFASAGGEQDFGSLGVGRYVQNASQPFFAALHPKAVEIDDRQLGPKVATL
jgi:hypothetical protein